MTQYKLKNKILENVEETCFNEILEELYDNLHITEA